MEEKLSQRDKVELLANYFLKNPNEKTITKRGFELLMKEKDRRCERRKLKM